MSGDLALLRLLCRWSDFTLENLVTQEKLAKKIKYF